MQLSALQLLEYTFDGVSVVPVDGYKADPEFAPGLVFFPGKLAMSADTGLALLDEKEKYSDFGVKLTLRVGPKEDAQAPYIIQVSVRGIVRMHLVQVVRGGARDGEHYHESLSKRTNVAARIEFPRFGNP